MCYFVVMIFDFKRYKKNYLITLQRVNVKTAVICKSVYYRVVLQWDVSSHSCCQSKSDCDDGFTMTVTSVCKMTAFVYYRYMHTHGAMFL